MPQIIENPSVKDLTPKASADESSLRRAQTRERERGREREIERKRERENEREREREASMVCCIYPTVPAAACMCCQFFLPRFTAV